MTDITCVGDVKAKLGESPIWDDRKQGLWWIDIYGQALHFHCPKRQSNETWDMPGKIAGVALTESGRLLAGMDGDVVLIDVADTPKIEILCSPVKDTSKTRLNEGKIDPSGAYYWIGEACYDFSERGGSLFRVDAQGQCETSLTGVGVSNGLAWSPDGSTLYFADTPTSTVWQFDYNVADGTLGKRRIFRTFEPDQGRPDGASVDTEGYYWIACVDHGKIFRLAPDGTIDKVIQLPVNYPTMCAFGDRDLDALYATTLSWRPINQQSTGEELAGRFMRCNTQSRGIPATRMKGL